MIKRINKTVEINQRLKEEGKLTYLDQPEDRKAFKEMNKNLEVMRRDYRVKEKKSLISSTNVTLM